MMRAVSQGAGIKRVGTWVSENQHFFIIIWDNSTAIRCIA